MKTNDIVASKKTFMKTTELQDAIYCIVSHKVRMATSSQMKKYLKRLQLFSITKLGYYQCKHCGGYHATSKHPGRHATSKHPGRR